MEIKQVCLSICFSVIQQLMCIIQGALAKVSKSPVQVVRTLSESHGSIILSEYPESGLSEPCQNHMGA